MSPRSCPTASPRSTLPRDDELRRPAPRRARDGAEPSSERQLSEPSASSRIESAVEINSRPERCDPPDDLLVLARDAGCLFSIDSDAHAPGQLDLLQFGCARAQEFDIPIERIVNTWERDRLVEWAARR